MSRSATSYTGTFNPLYFQKFPRRLAQEKDSTRQRSDEVISHPRQLVYPQKRRKMTVRASTS